MPRRLFFAIATLSAVVSLLYCFHVHLPITKMLLSKYVASEDVSLQTLVPQRKGLLIVGQGRSGTSFVSKMFANGDKVSQQQGPQKKTRFLEASAPQTSLPQTKTRFPWIHLLYRNFSPISRTNFRFTWVREIGILGQQLFSFANHKFRRNSPNATVGNVFNGIRVLRVTMQ